MTALECRSREFPGTPAVEGPASCACRASTSERLSLSQSMESNHPIRGYEPRPCTSIDCEYLRARVRKPRLGVSLTGKCRTPGVGPVMPLARRWVDPFGVEPKILRVGLLRVGAQSVDAGNRTLIARVKNEGTCRCTTSTEVTRRGVRSRRDLGV
jgi:hypothetical protein